MTGGGEAKLARGGAIQEPAFQHAVLHDIEAARGHAFAVERPRAQAAAAQRIIDDADTGREQALAELILEEACLACDGATIDRAGEMADDAAGDARIKHYRHPFGRGLARIDAL